MKYLILISCSFWLWVSCASPKALNRLKTSHSGQAVALDSLSRQLAEARRAQKKCEERITGFSSTMQENLNQLRNELDQQKKELNRQQQQNRKLTDSLQQNKEAVSALQQDWASKEMLRDQRRQQSMRLQQELQDSLSEYSAMHLVYVLDQGNLRLEVSDSILFGGYYYVLPRGKEFLKQFFQVLENYPNAKLQISCSAGKSIAMASQWRTAMTKAVSISSSLQNFTFDVARLTLIARQRDEKEERPPIFLEIQP